MKTLLFLVSISISLISTTALQYHKYLFLDSPPQPYETRLPQLDDTNNAHSFELVSIDHLLTKQHPTSSPQDQLLTLRLQRDLLRAESRSSSARVSKRLVPGYGSYFMRLGVGTPPKYVYMSLDTGSDITWLQCSPCKKCYKQPGPIFNPRHSSTFSQVSCGDPRCKQLQPYFYDGCHNNTSCLYNITYSDLSFSQGAFSTETLTLGSTTLLKNIALGCGHYNGGGFTWSAGLLGLGRGNLSFITQSGNRFQRQFSYCLAFSSSNSTSKSSIVFGPSAVTRKAVYTPLIYTNTTYYYVNLTGISVDGARVRGIKPSISDLKSNGDGGVILDSGTTYTRLVKHAYAALRKAFRAAIKKPKNSTLGPPRNYLWFDTCYDIYRETGRVEVPTVELHFDKGANMRLGLENTMILMYVDDRVATFCFAFMSNKWYTTIGNLQQKSIRIVYDLRGSQLGFVPHSC